MTPAERFWAKVDKTGECWIWTAARITSGYGAFWSGKRQVVAHRWAYEAMVGPIPEGLQLDHLCRNRACVRPDHLEPVTCGENIRRGDTGKGSGEFNRSKTHCSHGHPYDEENTYTNKNQRQCRTCQRIRSRDRQRRIRNTNPDNYKGSYRRSGRHQLTKEYAS